METQGNRNGACATEPLLDKYGELGLGKYLLDMDAWAKKYGQESDLPNWAANYMAEHNPCKAISWDEYQRDVDPAAARRERILKAGMPAMWDDLGPRVLDTLPPDAHVHIPLPGGGIFLGPAWLGRELFTAAEDAEHEYRKRQGKDRAPAPGSPEEADWLASVDEMYREIDERRAAHGLDPL